MRAEIFLDTNVLVYAIASDARHGTKSGIALDLIASADFGLSTQVMSEFYVTVTKKLAAPLSHERATEFLKKMRLLPIVSFDPTLVFEAMELKEEYVISYWDAAIIAAAQRLQASTIYSEDLNHGQLYGEIRVIDPFRTRK